MHLFVKTLCKILRFGGNFTNKKNLESLEDAKLVTLCKNTHTGGYLVDP